ncbi:chemotaxis protein CheW [Gemmatimonas groenlandica]|uniref:Chemotaxis protein CheW n=1 Tax=Gemmatimonas groenlandica TaxID=2732249 RepID=A0A6M4IKR3_9BACT|nr:chemotaxis protein CheW [Gemmatimonas groenlandica]QJR35313.1 chemotaxis protein CheW [Gemmatimonas groenlandica]
MSTFKSTALFAVRRRAVSTVERATFVCFSIGAHRLAGPVELIDRVLRPSTDTPGVSFEGRELPYADLASPLGLALGGGAVGLRRVLVAHVNDTWWALPVDAVHDVVSVDASEVLPLPAGHPDAHRVGAIATFTRGGSTVLVLDLVRLLR